MFTITVTAEDGSTKTYTVTVKRAAENDTTLASISVNGKLGIQLQSSSLPSHIKAMEAIKLFSKWNKSKIDSSLLEALNINDIEKNQYNQMSVGQKRRLHLALALVSNPDIIFLDEPTAGLDVEGRFALHQEIRKLKTQGKTIVLASHDMAEVDNSFL